MNYDTELGMIYLKDNELIYDFFSTLNDEDVNEVIWWGLQDCFDGEYYQNLLKKYVLEKEDLWNNWVTEQKREE